MTTQREMPFYRPMVAPKFAPNYVIDSFTCYRDAVVWCWDNRGEGSGDEDMDQAICARLLGIPKSHLNRSVKRDSKAPMNLNPDVYKEFQALCGWRAISQWHARKEQLTFMEEAQDLLRSRTASHGVSQCA